MKFFMKYTSRDIVVFAAGIIAIIASPSNIAMGISGTGFYLSVFVILMCIIVIVATLMKKPKPTE
jgi:hypothetical protein